MNRLRFWSTGWRVELNIADNSVRYDDRLVSIAESGADCGEKDRYTRAHLCEAVYQQVGLSRTKSANLVELVLKEITDCLERGGTVKLSSFGSFVVHKKGQRIGRNPKTGKEVPISPRRVMVFKPSAILKQRINSDRSRISADEGLGRIVDHPQPAGRIPE